MSWTKESKEIGYDPTEYVVMPISIKEMNEGERFWVDDDSNKLYTLQTKDKDNRVVTATDGHDNIELDFEEIVLKLV